MLCSEDHGCEPCCCILGCRGCSGIPLNYVELLLPLQWLLEGGKEQRVAEPCARSSQIPASIVAPWCL